MHKVVDLQQLDKNVIAKKINSAPVTPQPICREKKTESTPNKRNHSIDQKLL